MTDNLAMSCSKSQLSPVQPHERYNLRGEVYGHYQVRVRGGDAGEAAKANVVVLNATQLVLQCDAVKLAVPVFPLEGLDEIRFFEGGGGSEAVLWIQPGTPSARTLHLQLLPCEENQPAVSPSTFLRCVQVCSFLFANSITKKKRSFRGSKQSSQWLPEAHLTTTVGQVIRICERPQREWGEKSCSETIFVLFSETLSGMTDAFRLEQLRIYPKTLFLSQHVAELTRPTPVAWNEVSNATLLAAPRKAPPPPPATPQYKASEAPPKALSVKAKPKVSVREMGSQTPSPFTRVTAASREGVVGVGAAAPTQRGAAVAAGPLYGGGGGGGGGGARGGSIQQYTHQIPPALPFQGRLPQAPPAYPYTGFVASRMLPTAYPLPQHPSAAIETKLRLRVNLIETKP